MINKSGYECLNERCSYYITQDTAQCLADADCGAALGMQMHCTYSCSTARRRPTLPVRHSVSRWILATSRCEAHLAHRGHQHPSKNSSWNGYVSVRLLCSIFSTTIFYNDFDPQNVPVLTMHGHLALASPHHANRTCDTSNVWDIESMIQNASDSCYVGAMLQKASD